MISFVYPMSDIYCLIAGCTNWLRDIELFAWILPKVPKYAKRSNPLKVKTALDLKIKHPGNYVRDDEIGVYSSFLVGES